MSKFELDVDAPFDKPEKELLEQRPKRLDYPKNTQKYRFYGNNINHMIEVAKGWEAGDMKDALIFTIANHMKKCFLNWNKDTVEDEVIFKHLEELSKGELTLNPELLPLTSSADFLKVKSKNGNGPKSNNPSKPRKRNNRKRY